jgi:DNA-binding transcriptional LysR family regulator
MASEDLNVLAAFTVVAEERSFTRAARRLAVSPSALSHAIRGLEERIGVRLLARTTRSVAPTEAGDQLLGRLQPALGDVREALDQLAGLRIGRRGEFDSRSRRWRPRSCWPPSWATSRGVIRMSRSTSA